jgi:hypothetical protein
LVRISAKTKFIHMTKYVKRLTVFIAVSSCSRHVEIVV